MHRLLLLLFALGLILDGCAAHKRADYATASMDGYGEMPIGGVASGRGGYAMAEMARDEADYEAPAPPAEPEPAAVEASPSTVPAAAPDRMVHYDGFVRLRVTRIEEGVDAIRTLALARGGLVERVDSQSIVIRVPVASFEESFKAVLGLGEVMDKNISARDVTEAFTAVDLRLATSRATLARLQELLARSTDEKERLQLLRQIERLTEEIDRLEAQLRTLSALASLSRISVELVPREALAFQDAEDESRELSWIRQLSPFRMDPVAGEAGLDDKKLELAVPDGMVRLEERGPFIAEAADGARAWAWQAESQPEADAAWWLEAMRQRLGPDFASASQKSLGPWQVLVLTERGDAPYTWWIAVRREGRWLQVFQAWSPSPEASARHLQALEAVLVGGAS